jgi:hypothetical protein
MTERSDDLQRSRHEAALLLRLDPQNLSPSDALRCDLVATLRLSIDGAQADALEGRAADLGRLIVATESLVKLLPSEPPQPASRGADARQIMLETYLGMRRRGEPADATTTFEGRGRRIAELEARVAELEAGGAAATAVPPAPLPDNVVKLSSRNDNSSPPAAPPKPAAAAPPATPQYDYNKEQGWRDYIEPDGGIRSTPRGPGQYWGPV